MSVGSKYESTIMGDIIGGMYCEVILLQKLTRVLIKVMYEVYRRLCHAWLTN